MHLKSSLWYTHHHDVDKAYDNVILHVVLEDDATVTRTNGEKIPCLELGTRISPQLQEKYLSLLRHTANIPCAPQFTHVPDYITKLWLDRLLIERLETKTQPILQEIERNNQDWNAACYKYIGRCFGLHVNTDAFEMLCHSIDWKILTKHKDQLLQIEALLFGQAGMLDRDFEEDYPNRLKKEYAFLSNKYGLAPIPVQAWKFMRMRPSNFPSIRIAQFAFFIYRTEFLFSKLLAAADEKELRQIFTLSLDNYWKTHFVFDKASKASRKSLGKAMIDLILVNGVVPLYFAYGLSIGDSSYKDKALELLESLGAEKNHIMRFWKGLDMVPESAADSQALIQLKKRYCDKKRCLSCAVGSYILKQKG